jgi:hypothetical protein
MIRKITALGFGLAVSMLAATAAAEDAPAAAPAAAASTDSGGGGMGITLALRAGYALAFGNAAKDVKMSDQYKGGVPLQLDALYRVSPAFHVGAYVSYAFISLGDKINPTGDLSGSWLKYGLQLNYHFAPEASTDFWLGYGIGLEKASAHGSLGGIDVSASANGLEFAHIMAGLDFKASDAIKVGPFVDFSIGQYSSTSVEVNGTEVPGSGGDIKDKAMHMWLYLGLRGAYNL